MNELEISLWYAALEKPWFSPPASVFGPVWSYLYILIIISFGTVFWRVLQKEYPTSVVFPFLINIAANLAFSPLQFQLQNNFLALLDILIILCTIPWMMIVVWKRARWIALLQIPYLLWVLFATVLQISITMMN